MSTIESVSFTLFVSPPLFRLWETWLCRAFSRNVLTSVEPVKATLSMFIWLAIAAPAVGPNPGTIFTTPGGKPACMTWWKERALFVLPIKTYYIYIYQMLLYKATYSAFRLYVCFVSTCVSWESNPQPLRCWHNALPLSHRNTYWSNTVWYSLILSSKGRGSWEMNRS